MGNIPRSVSNITQTAPLRAAGGAEKVESAFIPADYKGPSVGSTTTGQVTNLHEPAATSQVGNLAAVDTQTIAKDNELTPLTKEQAASFVRYAAAGDFAAGLSYEGLKPFGYSGNENFLQLTVDKEVKSKDLFNYEILKDKDLSFADSCSGNILASETSTDYQPGLPVCHYDLESGLRFSLLIDKSRPDTIQISFGPAGSDIEDDVSKTWETVVDAEGKETEEETEESAQKSKELNSKFQNTQSSVAKQNLRGKKIPLAYTQAAEVVKQLQEKYPDKAIETSGHCFGGSLAQYAALHNDVKAVCTNTLPMGAAAQKELGADKLNKANELITHISVEGDYVSNNKMRGFKFLVRLLKFFGFKTPANFGKRFSIPPARESYGSGKRHCLIDQCILVYAGWRELHAKPPKPQGFGFGSMGSITP